MHFTNWMQSKRSNQDKKKNKKQHKKGSKKMAYGDYGDWQGKTSYPQGQGTGSYQYVGKNCSHPPNTPVAVGNWHLFPTQDKFITSSVLENFDVVCPLTEFSGGIDYNRFCGVLMWIPIKDMSAPDHLRLRANAQRIVDLMKADNTIALWCVGSHGRTGTVLATCIGLCEPDVDPVETVRERHCKHAIETQSQVEVVFKALGRPLPEKYKVKPEPRRVPAYISEGKGWKTDDSRSNIVAGATVCTYCKHVGTYNDSVHWYGQIPAHVNCYNIAQDNIRKATEAANAVANETAEEKTNPGVVDVSKQPDPDTVVLGIGGELIVRDREPLDNALLDPTLATMDEYLEALKKERPFLAHWKVGYRDQVEKANVKNKVDVFGDKICAICSRLVTDPKNSNLLPVKDDMYLIHEDCQLAMAEIETEVLCAHCLDNVADEDGYCSMSCAALGAFNKAQNTQKEEINNFVKGKDI